MKSSVCVCSYNGEKYIKNQLESIINQTVAVDEIILCDDNSNDNTVVIAEEVLSNSNIKYSIIKNDYNLGVTKNFEKCCANATGDIIFFADQDDIWLTDKVEIIKNAFAQNPQAELVFSDAILFDNDGDLKESCWERFGFSNRLKDFKKNQIDCILKSWFVTGATMATSRILIEKCMPFSENLLHDQLLSFVACSKDSCVPINKKLIKYRQHDQQVVGAQKYTLKEKMNFVVDTNKEVLMLESLKNYVDDSSVADKINDKCEYIKNRQKLKSKNKFLRIFYYMSLLRQYKKFSVNPIKSYLKDVVK